MATCPTCGVPIAYDGAACGACAARERGGVSLSRVEHAAELLRVKHHSAVVNLLSPGTGWLADHPEDVRAWELLAAAHAGLREWRAAERASRRVVDLAPGRARALVRWGTTLRKLGRLSEARAAQEHALRLQPGHAPALRELGKIGEQGDAHGCEGGAEPPPSSQEPVAPSTAPDDRTPGARVSVSGDPEREVLFNNQGTVVTPSFVSINQGQVFAVAHITSVAVREWRRPRDTSWPTLLIVAGGVVLLIGLVCCADGTLLDAALVLCFLGAGMVLLGVLWLRSVPEPWPVHLLYIVSAAGEVEACSSYDKGFIEDLARAVMAAVARR